MKNGNGEDDPRVSSLDDARRRKAERTRAAQRTAQAAGGGGTLGQKIFGAIAAAMAIAYIAWLFGAFGGDGSLPVSGAL